MPVGGLAAETATYKVNYLRVADVAEVCRAAFKRNLEGGKKADIQINEKDNSLIVTGPKEAQELVAKLIKEIDVRPDQVFGEFLFVEAIDMKLPFKALAAKLGSQETVIRRGLSELEKLKDFLRESETYRVLSSGQFGTTVGDGNKNVFNAGDEGDRVSLEFVIKGLTKVPRRAKITRAHDLPGETHIAFDLKARLVKGKDEMTTSSIIHLPNDALVLASSFAHTRKDGSRRHVMVLLAAREGNLSNLGTLKPANGIEIPLGGKK